MDRQRLIARLGAIAGLVMLAISSAAPAGAQTATPTPAPAALCRVVAANLTLRGGPGTAFAAVGSLLTDTPVRAISFVRAGTPTGSWIEVELSPGASSGFLPADSQSVRCQPAVTTLPLAKAPPAPGQTRQRISRVATDGPGVDTDQPPALLGVTDTNGGQYVIVPGVDQNQLNLVLEANGQRLRFGDALGFGVEVADRRQGRTDGSGIREVRFEVSYADPNTGQKVVAYKTTESRSPYCLFSDENGQCNVFRFSKMGYKWPDTRFGRGLPRPPGETEYNVLITIVATNNEQVQWFWSFVQNAISVELP